MKLQKYIPSFLLAGLLAVGLSSCFNDLEVTPIDPDEVTANVVYEDDNAYRQVLAKLYAGLAVSGQEGPAGQPDINGIDEGFSTYLRQYWKAQELTTDEAVIAWNDGNIHDFEDQDWDENNEFIRAMYDRIYFQIALCNEFLRESTDAKLDSRGQSSLIQQMKAYRAEARFLRALSYWHALDLFRNVPFVTEDDGVGFYLPNQFAPRDLFDWIEQELRSIDGDLLPPGTNEYGRADQAAGWMLSAKQYLNAEVHTGENRYSDCIEFTNKVINAGYTLEPNYEHLFMADNHRSSEIIFPIAFDGIHTRTFGGMTFVIHAAVGGDMPPADFGIDGGWGGTRTTSALVDKFGEGSGCFEVIAEAIADNDSYPTVNVPGGYQGWDPELETTVLASVNSDDNYEGYFYFAENEEFKLALDGWGTNWGDDNNDGILDLDSGTNLTVPVAGFYRVRANLADLSYSVELTEWGVIGDATADEWASDQDMTYNATEGAWVLELALIPGAIKFRANNDWPLNYGDTGADGILEEGGDNISITDAGTYQIKLYLDKPDHSYSIAKTADDGRAMFYTNNQSLEISDVSQFTQGYAISKFKNIDQNGIVGSDLTYPDTDFPMFRLADAYLMYAEAVVRGGGGGDMASAVGYINQLQERTYGSNCANIAEADLTLDFLLDERARELYWEAHRRTDLIRFGQFSDGTYVWPLKGGTLGGTQVASFYDIFPIPVSDLGVNPNLSQNDGY